MADDIVYDAIRAHLDPAKGGSWNATAIQWENEGPCTTANESGGKIPWLMIELSGNIYGQTSIGAGEQSENRWDADGQLFGHVFVPSGDGSSEARRLAKAFADKFRGALLADDSIEFGDASIGRGAPGDENGSWYRISVTIDWMRTEA